MVLSICTNRICIFNYFTRKFHYIRGHRQLKFWVDDCKNDKSHVHEKIEKYQQKRTDR